MSARLLSIPDAAAALGCSRKHVYRLIADGSLRAVPTATRAGRRGGYPKMRVPESEIERLSKVRRAS